MVLTETKTKAKYVQRLLKIAIKMLAILLTFEEWFVTD